MDQQGQEQAEPLGQLGPYRLVRLVGRGGMSAVYEAEDTRIGRRVAVKVLSAPHLPSEDRDELVVRIRREARVIANLSHPNVVTVFDVGEQNHLYYLVMEFLDGETLRQRIQRGGPLSYGAAAHILDQVADALDAVHAAGVVHRDLKGSNVMLLPPGGPTGTGPRAKLLDFGVALAPDDEGVTLPGTMIGTPAYLAPEIITGGKASSASDVWALGVLLYEMLAGRAPFGAGAMESTLYQIVHDPPAPLVGVPDAVQDVIAFALDKQPEQRFATGHSLARAFRDALRSAEMAVPGLMERTPTPPGQDDEPATVIAPPRGPARPAPLPVGQFPPTEQFPPIPPAPPTRPGKRSAGPLFLALALMLAAIAAVGGALIRGRREARTLTTPPTPSAAAAATAPPAPKASPASRPRKPVAVAAAPRPAVSPSPRPKPRATPRPTPRPKPSVTVAPIIIKETTPPEIASVPTAEPTPERTRRPAASLPPPPAAPPLPVPTPTPAPLEGIVEPVPPPGPTRRRPSGEAVEPRAARPAEPGEPQEIEVPDGDEAARLREDLTSLRDEWLRANEAGDVDGQARFYPPQLDRYYTLRGATRAQVLRDKAFVVGGAERVVMTPGPATIRFERDGVTALMRFRKDYEITGGRGARRGAVLQELRWRLTEEGWKIVSERDLRVLR